MGYLYRPKLKSGNRASVDWIKYYVNGRPIRESTRTDDKEQAKRHLKQREGAAANGQPVLPRVDRITYQEVAKDLRTHYETTGCRDLDEADGRLAPLKAFFAGHWVARIGPAEAAAYAAKRQAAGAANATIHRELAVLIRMFRLAYERGKLFRLPVIRKLKEAGPRQGFFEREPYAAVRKHLAPDLQLATGIAYAFGWRMQSEVLTLELRQVDLDAGTLRQEPGTPKKRCGPAGLLPARSQGAARRAVRSGADAGTQDGPDHPFPLPAPPRAQEGPTAAGLPQDLGRGVPAGGPPGPAPA